MAKKQLIARSLLSIDNRNPGSVKQDFGDPWFGSDGADSQRHAKFKDWCYGIRAFIRNIQRVLANLDPDKRTLLGLLEVWAPDSDPDADNNPREYAETILVLLSPAYTTHLGVDMKLDLFGSDLTIKDEGLLMDLMRCMTQVEIYRGFTLPWEYWTSGLNLFKATYITGAVKVR